VKKKTERGKSWKKKKNPIKKMTTFKMKLKRSFEKSHNGTRREEET
jgi:hypothetical protein